MAAKATRPRWRKIVKRVLIALSVIVLVVGGITAWAVNRYIIDHVQIANVAAYEASVKASTTTVVGASPTTTVPAGPALVTDTSYTHGTTSISIRKVVTGSGNSTVTYFVADVVLGDAGQLRSAFAENKFGTNIIADTSTIAEQNGAMFAINGDYYGYRGSGIVIRNGIVFRDDGARKGLAISRDGTMAVYDEEATDADQLVADGVWTTLSFGPGLVVDGEVVAGIDDVEVDTNIGNHSIQGNQPRTGIGMIGPNHFVFVVVDGRSTGYSRGVTMTEFAQIFVDLGATVAYNLDGGGSSTMVWADADADGTLALVNDPLGKGEERGTSDILYVAGVEG